MIPPISLILISFLFTPIIIHGLKAPSLSLELVRRPHDPRTGRFERVKELARRDMLRHDRRRKMWESVEMRMHAGRDYGSGEYFVEVRIGNPPQKFWLIADTGSDLTWVNCNDDGDDGGVGSSRKNVFSARRSRTFQAVLCSSKQCKVDLSDLFSLQTCPRPSDPCLYDFRYADGSAALGSFGFDTITVGLSNGKKGKVNNMLIGCTRSTINGQTLNGNIDGILGLGLSRDSFVTNVASQYGGKFSYCLVDHLSHKNISNFLTFGTTITPKSKLLTEIHKTPLVKIPPLYGLNVVGISIGGQMLKIPPMVWDFKARGGAILDSGTSLTILTMPAYKPLMEILVGHLGKFERVKASPPFEYCYNSSGVGNKGFDESVVPRLAFHFALGVRFEPPVKSYVIDVGPSEKCIGILGADWPGASTIGNIMQQNHLWEFDLVHNTVGFAPSTCHN
ncbi:aspartic proteinase NANA, chloroplast-like [Senna tora]|uniref:Aspartic proteinase NANA, chloroplast-like n=1 Tax=Senna tora TaxID=362788 RepID=A0A835CEC8_9FABA|nr:aspartic proteinase NANA, chloroplast-like [Senna tora]